MAEPAVIVEKDGPVLVVTLNRPEKRNAVNCEVMCRLYDAWNELDRDDELRVAILTGKGNTFCAGMDLSEIGKLSSGKPDNEWMERVMSDFPTIYGAWLKTYRPTKPVILAAEGFARAGGTEILRERTSASRARAPCSASPRCSAAFSRWPARRCGSAARSATRSPPRCSSAVRTCRRSAPASSA